MATGRVAFSGSTSAVIFHAILERTPPNPSTLNSKLPARFDEIASKALEKDRALRYQSAAEIGADLKRLKRDTDSTRVTAATAVVTKAAPPERNSKLRMGVLAASLSVAVVVALALLFGVKREKEVSVDSVAVLPFVNATGNPDIEYLSEGITQGLINTLAQLPKLKVVSLMSAYRYKGKSIDPPAVARELGVHAILTGRMVQQGDTISISTELIDAEHDRQIWGKQYQRKLTDVTSLQPDITRDIVENLKLRLSGAQQNIVAQRPTQNSEAYQLYLQGRFYWNRRTTGGANKAIDYFQQAIAKDPDYALAYSGLADSYFTLARNNIVLSPKEAGAKARQAAEKAVEIDPALAEGHASLGNVLLVFEWDFAGAERELRRAIDLNASYPYAHVWYAELLLATGRYEESIRENRKAVALEPFTPSIRVNLGLSLMFANHLEESEQFLRQTLDMDPNYAITHYIHAEVLILQKRFDEAVTEMEKTVKSLPESSYYRGFLGYTLAKAGRATEARKILGEIIEESKTKYVSWLGIADIYSGLGEKDHYFAALELAYQQGDTRMDVIRARTEVDSIWADDPRFAELLKKIGLPPLN
jgi:TolB-like protein/Tfp pilus assembly protein PilF